MSHEEDVDEIDYESMEEFQEQGEHSGASPTATDEQLRQEWNNATESEHLPTIPGTAILDSVQGDTYLWDKTCNKGLRYDGELMARVDYKPVGRNK